MPHRFNALLENLTIFYTLVGSWFASIAASLPDIMSPGSLIEDGKLRIVCVCGGLGGSLLSALLWPPKSGSGREFGLKVMSSSLVAIIFTPLLFHWQTLPRSADIVLGTSGIVGMLGVTIIRAITPKIVRVISNRIVPDDKDDKEAEKKP